MRIALVIFLSTWFQSTTFAQTLYKDSIYGKVNVSTHTFKSPDGTKLEMDYYRADGVTGKLPLIVYVHGGGFNSGTRNSQGIQYFAKRLAKRGYAVTSVSYRLTLKDAGAECEITEEQKKKAIKDASLDVTMGVKYISENSSLFMADVDKVILIGSSAGGEAVLNMVYGMDSCQIISKAKFAGVISMSGSLLDLEGITAEKAIPTQLFHGTADEIVPYKRASHYYCKRSEPGYCVMYGSKLIANRLKQLGTSYYLYSINGGTHSWAGVPTKRCFIEIIDFLYNDIMNPSLTRQTERTVTEKK